MKAKQILEIFIIFASGPALGSSLYIAGGFSLPFLVIGSLALVMAIVLAVVVPKIDSDEKDRLNSSKSTTLTFAALFSVRNFYDGI